MQIVHTTETQELDALCAAIREYAQRGDLEKGEQLATEAMGKYPDAPHSIPPTARRGRTLRVLAPSFRMGGSPLTRATARRTCLATTLSYAMHAELDMS